MIGIAAIWIVALLLIGGFALDRVLSRTIVDNFDSQLVYMLNSMVDAAEIADIVAFLASPRSVAINGDAIACGGGTRGAIHY